MRELRRAMKFIAVINERAVIERILKHVSEDSDDSTEKLSVILAVVVTAMFKAEGAEHVDLELCGRVARFQPFH